MQLDLDLLRNIRLLFIEDEIVLQKNTAEMLSIFFGSVLVANHGLEAMKILATEKIDIILSDIKMPVMDGLTLVRKLRTMNNQTPFIVLTSYSDQQTLLEAANAGIDGYVIKPIDLDDLMQTFMRVLMRKTPNIQQFSFANGIVYNIPTQELFCHGSIVDLGKRERELLQLFIKNPDKTLTKEKLISTIWQNEEITESALKNLLARLRKKIGYDLIISVKGSGWRLNISG